MMCTSRGLLSKAHDDPLYLLNHAYDTAYVPLPKHWETLCDAGKIRRRCRARGSHATRLPIFFSMPQYVWPGAKLRRDLLVNVHDALSNYLSAMILLLPAAMMATASGGSCAQPRAF